MREGGKGRKTRKTRKAHLNASTSLNLPMKIFDNAICYVDQSPTMQCPNVPFTYDHPLRLRSTLPLLTFYNLPVPELIVIDLLIYSNIFEILTENLKSSCRGSCMSCGSPVCVLHVYRCSRGFLFFFWPLLDSVCGPIFLFFLVLQSLQCSG
jgi:hypothetical protein